MKFLVCGGAGYVGSHMVCYLLRHGHEVVVYDNLSTGHAESVGDIELVRADLLDASALATVFAAHRFEAVLHFSALSLVADSIRNPYDYYENNVSGTLNLLQAMRKSGIDKLVFSSSAAVFGLPHTDQIDEDHPTEPISPYGTAKLMVERILEDAAHAYGLRSVALRYFNAAGADPSGRIGESHHPETHLIPNVLAAALDATKTVAVYGNDYPTADGTCVRDYVHVNDLASAHLAAIDYLAGHAGAHRFNLGNGCGFSVREVIAAARRVTGAAIEVVHEPRRPGDPPFLVASSTRARELLAWQPRFETIEAIIETAWRWHRQRRY